MCIWGKLRLTGHAWRAGAPWQREVDPDCPGLQDAWLRTPAPPLTSYSASHKSLCFIISRTGMTITHPTHAPREQSKFKPTVFSFSLSLRGPLLSSVSRPIHTTVFGEYSPTQILLEKQVYWSGCSPGHSNMRLPRAHRTRGCPPLRPLRPISTLSPCPSCLS